MSRRRALQTFASTWHWRMSICQKEKHDLISSAIIHALQAANDIFAANDIALEVEDHTGKRHSFQAWIRYFRLRLSPPLAQPKSMDIPEDECVVSMSIGSYPCHTEAYNAIMHKALALACEAVAFAGVTIRIAYGGADYDVPTFAAKILAGEVVNIVAPS